MDNLDKLNHLYNKGFKCIRYEDGEEGEFRAYFKNFETEQIDSIKSYNEEEITEMKNFIDSR
ncbi:hypothetical protein [Thermohalobacter berrensis]|uniref:Uncharacterized protein n=1 Tax=Thermohalobacter berrensis TaxID=99594 RepID=A0A419T4L9_9FIRM|nr:hypothetical protein [Thermohalobacter berrensis]RKD32484.1 hypothetical protein BET03_11280 [Thermohalobacter berrensis]